MLNTIKIKKIYEKIQNKLFYMIPEKWDSVYLYASVLEQMQDYLTGEMYFYYFPKGILKKNPVNGYEISGKFNIAEEAYSKHIEELYDIIKELWKEFYIARDKPWYSITISIEKFKFKIEYNYTDIREYPYSATQMHIIWKYKYLKTELDSYYKKERQIIERYLAEGMEEEIEIYDEGVYKNPIHHRIQYEKEQTEEEIPLIPQNQIILKK